MTMTITHEEQLEVERIADKIGVYGITIALAKWCEGTGGLAFVKRCVESCEMDHESEAAI